MWTNRSPNLRIFGFHLQKVVRRIWKSMKSTLISGKSNQWNISICSEILENHLWRNGFWKVSMKTLNTWLQTLFFYWFWRRLLSDCILTEQRLLKMCNWSIAGRKCIPAMMFSTTCSRLKIQRTGASSLLKPGHAFNFDLRGAIGFGDDVFKRAAVQPWFTVENCESSLSSI